MTENHRKIKFEKQLLLNFIRDVKKQFPKKHMATFYQQSQLVSLLST